MDLGHAGKRVLVTGGSKGIGLACARAFAAEGAIIAIASRDRANLDKAKATLAGEGIAVFCHAADLIDPDAAKKMAVAVEQAIGPVDILVNSAGAAMRAPPTELTPGHWHRAMDAKFFTYIHAIDAVIAGMAARGDGAIVNVVGTGGKVAAITHLAGGSANAALMLASAGLANAYASKGVRVVAVNPGLTATTRVQEGLEADARLAGSTPELVLARFLERQPLGRMAQPEEIADTVLFVASKRATFLTGAVLTMDGAANPTVV